MKLDIYTLKEIRLMNQLDETKEICFLNNVEKYCENMRILLTEAHDVIDNNNFINGEKNKFCLLCLSNKYDGKEGIIHSNDCLIKRIREELWK